MTLIESPTEIGKIEDRDTERETKQEMEKGMKIERKR